MGFSRGERARNSSAHSGMACGIMIFAIFALLVATVVTCVSGTRLLQQSFPVSRLGPRLGSAARARRPPSARFYCNGGLARDARNDFIVSLKGGYDLDLVIDSLERVPANLQPTRYVLRDAVPRRRSGAPSQRGRGLRRVRCQGQRWRRAVRRASKKTLVLRASGGGRASSP